MRIYSVLLLVCAAAGLGAAPAKRPAAKQSAPKHAVLKRAPAAQSAPAATPRKATGDIPAGAKKVDDYTYEYTDASGKTFYYRRTPFGVMRSEKRAPDASAPAETERTRVSPFVGGEPAPAAPMENVTATESGDSVTFVRTTPFGKQRWTRRKAEMTDAERAYLDHSKAEPAKTDR